MVARLCAVAFIAFASLLVVGNGTVRAADDYSNSQSDDSYSTPDTEQQPAAPDDGSADRRRMTAPRRQTTAAAMQAPRPRRTTKNRAPHIEPSPVVGEGILATTMIASD